MLRRKFNTFQRDPIGSTSTKVKSELRTRLFPILERLAKSRLNNHVCLDFLASRPPNALSPSFMDLLYVYSTVRLRKPRYILEFGSGSSTAVIAQALRDNYLESSENRGFVYSLDADPHWARVTLQSIQSMSIEMEDFYEIRYAPVIEVTYLDTPAFRHTNVPDIECDLLYLDGPTLAPERQVAVDVLDIEDCFPPGFFMIVDGREANTMFLKTHLKRCYIFKERWLYHSFTFELVG